MISTAVRKRASERVIASSGRRRWLLRLLLAKLRVEGGGGYDTFLGVEPEVAAIVEVDVSGGD